MMIEIQNPCSMQFIQNTNTAFFFENQVRSMMIEIQNPCSMQFIQNTNMAFFFENQVRSSHVLPLLPRPIGTQRNT